EFCKTLIFFFLIKCFCAALMVWVFACIGGVLHSNSGRCSKFSSMIEAPGSLQLRGSAGSLCRQHGSSLAAAWEGRLCPRKRKAESLSLSPLPVPWSLTA
uniref:Uncharacterized protein n=1 Tax=Crocodylus porosus TaxID=8502 RepID=A0A7M4ED60_CROPO